MADILTRLLLNTQGFDANLNKAKGSVNSFQSEMSSITSKAAAGVAKFAGAIGIAAGGVEAFKKTIGSTQTTGDLYVKRMDQAKASVDAFFTSIAMGNVAGFLENMNNIIAKAGDLSVVLDELATKSLFSDAELNNLMMQKRIQENIAKDRTKSDAERNKALEKARDIQIQINNLQKGLEKTQRESAYATLDAAIAKQGFNGNIPSETWDFAMQESNRPKILEWAQRYKDRRLKSINDRNVVYHPETGEQISSRNDPAVKEFEKYANSANGRLEQFAYIFSEMDDNTSSDLGKAIALFKQANSMAVAISDAEFQLNRVDSRINGAYNTNNNGQGGEKKVFDPGSIGSIDQQISDLGKKYQEATDDATRKGVHSAIEKMKAEKMWINIEARVDKTIMPKMAGIPSSVMKGTEIPDKIEPLFENEDVKTNEDYMQSLQAIGAVMGSISQMTDDGAAAWLTWGANALSAIAQAIPMIEALTLAKQTEAMVNGVRSATETPVIGWLLAGAAVAAVAASFASMPKFADGGIFDGGKYSGDLGIARLNKGEMILNDTQQANLFRVLNSGGSSGIRADEVVFKLRGDELIGLMNNTSKKRSKIS